MKLTTSLALTAVLIGTASCAGPETTYGPTTAGPTVSSSPSAEPAPPPRAPQADPPRQRRPAATSLCELFSVPEVTGWLGLPVGQGTLTSDGSFRVCSWRALDPPSVPQWREGDPVLATDDGIVTITRGRASEYAELERRVTAAAEAKKAGGRQDLAHLYPGAFAVGASVSGVPLWTAVALHEDAVIAVEVSGADSRSSIARVTGFLGRTLDRL